MNAFGFCLYLRRAQAEYGLNRSWQDARQTEFVGHQIRHLLHYALATKRQRWK